MLPEERENETSSLLVENIVPSYLTEETHFTEIEDVTKSTERSEDSLWRTFLEGILPFKKENWEEMPRYRKLFEIFKVS